MEKKLLHIFRNTPLGRETFLQSLYFCRKTNTTLVVYVPGHIKFLMYFENDVVQVDLDESYRNCPDTAALHIDELLSGSGVSSKMLEPKDFTASTLPDIPVDFHFMTCPRSLSDKTSKIGLGYIGSRVRRIVKSAHFPVLITSSVYKPWESITVFFGGSENSLSALRLGFRMSRLSGMPLRVFTHGENRDQDHYRGIIEKAGLAGEMQSQVETWDYFQDGSFEENLYNVPHDSLAILGAYGHGLIKDILFGSKMEVIHSTLANNFLVVGPNYQAVS